MGQPLTELFAGFGIDADTLDRRTFRFIVNDQETFLEWSPYRVRINGEETSLSSVAQFGDQISFAIQEAPRLREVLEIDQNPPQVELTVNKEPVVLSKGGTMLHMNGNPVTLDHVLEDGAVIKYKLQESLTIVSDLLNHITITPRPSGNLIIRVNGLDAGFTTPVHSGDQVDLYWEDVD